MCLRQVSYTQRLSSLQLKSFNPASHRLAEIKLQKCLLGVQTSHLLLMASNRNSICDIWSHKTINSDREIVNSTSRCISFSDVDLISAPILATCLNWAQLGSLQRFAISSTRWGRLLRDGNENIMPQNSLIEKGMGLQRSQHLNGKHLWPKYRFINLWTILCDISLTLQGSVSLKAEIYISLCENIDRSAVWSEIPSRLANRLELHQDLPFWWGKNPNVIKKLWANLPFLWKKPFQEYSKYQ